MHRVWADGRGICIFCTHRGSKDGDRNVESRAWVMEEAAEKAGNV